MTFAANWSVLGQPLALAQGHLPIDIAKAVIWGWGIELVYLVCVIGEVTVNGRLRATLGPGDYFGEMAIIDRGPRSATVTCETDVQTLGIASWDFMPVLSENFEMCRKIMVELSRRLRNVEKSLAH